MLEMWRAGLDEVARRLQGKRISRREAELLECFRRMENRDQESMLRFGAALAGRQTDEPPA
ncbi:hypothetical protein D3C78_1990960 [compost metagenome]